eukprot:5022711-Alexandrium_andersonii.AAC.1
MSASLVGSEMCIRDRAARRRPLSSHPPRRPAQCPPARLVRGTPDQAAVSYTHLTLPTICSV